MRCALSAFQKVSDTKPLDVPLQSTYVGTRKYLDELTAEATRRVHSVVRNARIMNGT